MLLPGAGIMGSLPWPRSIYMGSGDLLSVPCVCTTNIWSTEPDPQTQHWLSCPPTTRRAPLFPAPLHRVLEMTEPWDHALKLLNFESQYLLLPLKGGKKKRRGERERDEKTTDLAKEHDGPIQHAAGSYMSGKERVLQGTTFFWVATVFIWGMGQKGGGF